MRHLIDRLLKNGKTISFPPRGDSTALLRIDFLIEWPNLVCFGIASVRSGGKCVRYSPYPTSTRAPLAHMTQVSKTVGKIMRSLASFYQSFTKR